jgi:hypothetical protein
MHCAGRRGLKAGACSRVMPFLMVIKPCRCDHCWQQAVRHLVNVHFCSARNCVTGRLANQVTYQQRLSTSCAILTRGVWVHRVIR